MNDNPAPPILALENVYKRFPAARRQGRLGRRGVVRALDGVSLTLRPGEIVGLVGESGSGKSTLAMSVMGLEPPTEGRVLLEGDDLYATLRGPDRLAIRRKIQLIFQDPYESLNPRQTIYDILSEPLWIHHLVTSRAEAETRVIAALNEVGLTPPQTYLTRRPEGLSGGQRQRVGIAAALILDPQVVVADEPVSMLDVSLRSEILMLLRNLRDRRGLTLLYITHDLATAALFTDRIAVLYLGRIVEEGRTAQVLREPQHPYTRALLSVIPVSNPRLRRPREILQGEIPDATEVPRGCRFHPRCPDAIDRCRLTDPQLMPTASGQRAACILTGVPLHAVE
ncbi:MAG: ABC transporter ATP-binding protein [Chloroflexi bacterium]|nr:ABC transporter ATP-binding protein [Chloroflexota bacterium]